jgi:hypothetical protein
MDDGSAIIVWHNHGFVGKGRGCGKQSRHREY